VVIEPTAFVQSVEETGVVHTDVSITYGWERNGRIIEVMKKQGDIVYTGDVIAQLADDAEQHAARQAQAALDRARASLNEVLAGPTPEERATYVARIQQAQASLAQAKTDLEKTRTAVSADIASAERAVAQTRNELQETATGSTQHIDDAYENLYNTMIAVLPNFRDALTKADNILGIDNVFANDAYESYLSQQQPTALNKAFSQYGQAKEAVRNSENTLSTLAYHSEQSEIDATASRIQTTLQEVTLLLQYVSDALDATSPAGNFTQTELDALKTSIISEKISLAADSTALAKVVQAVSAAKNAMVTAQIAYDSAIADVESTRSTGDALIASAERLVDLREAAVGEAQASYDAFVAPPRSVDIAALRADVAKADALYDAAALDVAHMTLTALATGTITMLDVHVGETIVANQSVVTIQSDARLIEVDISETDIAKISIGDAARVTFDAYDDHTYVAYVRSIDPAATEISGVIYYTIELELHTTEDPIILPEDVAIDYSLLVNGPIANIDVRPGMSADVEIITYASRDSFVLPRRALITEGKKRLARILTDPDTGAYELKEVQIGKTGNDGLVEILSGVSEGDEVITFIEE
jgi:multidrug resistance efflux pump